MAQQSTAGNTSKLLKRTVSAVLLLAFASSSFWYGGAFLKCFVFVLCFLLIWEWCGLLKGLGPIVCFLFSIFISLGVVLAASFLSIKMQFWLICVILVFGQLISLMRVGVFGFIFGMGPALIVIMMMAAIFLRNLSEFGLETVCWVVLVVSAMDIGGYFVGKAFGRRRLAPRISPNKTYAGLIGGMTVGAVASVFFGHFLGSNAFPLLFALGAGLAGVSQLGDLLESSWKRHFNVKDSSDLLPGHGGFLDRFDGYLTALPVVALMTFLLGRSPLLWQ